jgi:predicted phosphodiesterase
MKIKTWVRNKFLEHNTNNKSIIYGLYNEACMVFNKTIPPETYSRTVRKVYNELYTNESPVVIENHDRELINMGKVLVVGDLHTPFENKDYLEFCKQQYTKYKCKTVVMIGDIVDNHAISYHEHDPNGMAPSDELETAINHLQDWYKAFPNVYVCFGNHDLLIERKARTNGLPRRLFKSFSEILGAPKGWKFNYSWQIDGVKYMHGTGGGGKTAHITRALKNRQSTVLGHFHTVLSVDYLASHHDLIFGMGVGCGIDINSYAMEYGKDFVDRPILGCGIVISSREAYTVPMQL